MDLSINSSSASNSSNVLLQQCTNSRVSVIISFAGVAMRTVLTLPPCSLILYLGLQRWRQQRSFKATSHSDILTYHMAAMELIWVSGSSSLLWGIFGDLPEMIIVAFSITSFVFCGENFFHLLTCVERYLAVVHPVTYLPNARGVRIRNISAGCVWLLCFGWMGVTLYLPIYPTIPMFCLFVFSLIVMFFCAFSILCVLIRPGPGEGGREKERVDQAKQRAFHTIAAIMGVLWLWLAGLLVFAALETSALRSQEVACVVMASATWFNLPSSLVLPLLYLHRAGKLSCCCCNNE